MHCLESVSLQKVGEPKSSLGGTAPKIRGVEGGVVEKNTPGCLFRIFGQVLFGYVFCKEGGQGLEGAFGQWWGCLRQILVGPPNKRGVEGGVVEKNTHGCLYNKEYKTKQYQTGPSSTNTIECHK